MPKTNSLKKKIYLFQVSLINEKKGFVRKDREKCEGVFLEKNWILF